MLLIALGGLVLIVAVLWDGFETIVLPRRVTSTTGPSRIFFQLAWRACAAVACRLPTRRRTQVLAVFGPLSVLLLLGIWACGLIGGFALLHLGTGSRIDGAEAEPGLSTFLYYSGTTFFTLGLGDMTPGSTLGRFISVVEAGTGFAFLALVIGYVPVLYQTFARREARISLLDARAGSPPSAVELLRRLGHTRGTTSVETFLSEWEGWCADLLESHLSYPLLVLFRSHHANQSWLAALTTVLDTSALAIVGLDGVGAEQARLTFAMARHVAVDLCATLGATPDPRTAPRLTSLDAERVQTALLDAGLRPRRGDAAARQLTALVALYEPYLLALGEHTVLPVPDWFPTQITRDNWQIDGWTSAGRGEVEPAE